MKLTTFGSLGLAISTLILAGCGGSSSGGTFTPVIPDEPLIRVIHASSDAPNVDVKLDGVTSISDLAYKANSGFVEVNDGTYSVAVGASGFTDTANAVIGPVDLMFDEDTRYDIIAVNKLNAIEPVVLADDGELSDMNNVRVRVAHLNPDAPAVDVYVTAPNALMAESSALGSLSFKEAIGPVEVPGGEYRIRITAAGDNTAVVYDSGLVNLAAGGDLLVGAVEPEGAEGAVSLLVLNDANSTVAKIDSMLLSPSVRVTHAVADAPPVNVYVDMNKAISDLDYKMANAWAALTTGDNTIEVKGVLDGTNEASVIGPVTLDLASSTRYDIVAVGDLANIETVVIPDTGILSDSSKVRVRVAHTAFGVPAVDVYVTAVDAGDVGALDATVSNLDFKASTDALEIDPGDYRIRLAIAGTDTVAYDTVGTAALGAGSDLLIAAVNNTGSGSAPVSLIVSGDTGVVADIFDGAANSRLKAIHASGAAGPVDLLINDAEVAGDFPFAGDSDYLSITSSDAVNVKVNAANTNTSAINADLPFANGAFYTVIAVNDATSETGVNPILLMDDNREFASALGLSRLRVIHGADVLPIADVYLLPAGTALSGQTPTLDDFAFKGDTGMLTVAAGSYDIYVTASDNQTPVITATGVSLAAETNYTVIAREGDDGTVDANPGLIVTTSP